MIDEQRLVGGPLDGLHEVVPVGGSPGSTRRINESSVPCRRSTGPSSRRFAVISAPVDVSGRNAATLVDVSREF